MHDVLEEEAAGLRPGESGLLALDWWNGNRSVLVDADLRGLLRRDDARDARTGDLPRADRGDRVRHARDRRGVRAPPASAVDGIVACGGLPERNPLLMQVFADVTGREFAVAALRARRRRSASAMFGAVAAGAGSRRLRHDRRARRSQMAHLAARATRPGREHRAAYDALYGEYVRLHDLFGRGGDECDEER